MSRTFEELPVWQSGRELVRAIYAASRRTPFSRDTGLCDQIQRAAVSVCSNIAEGHERGSTADLIQFLFYAKGSAGEVRSQLYHAQDLAYVSAAEAETLRARARDISRQISAWIQSMQAPGFAGGPKFHKEPDWRMEKFWEKMGFERLPNGQMRRKAVADSGRRPETEEERSQSPEETEGPGGGGTQA